MTTVDPPPPRPDPAPMLGWLPRLRRYARVLRRNREDADDLVQDTLERAWSRIGQWQGVGDMRTWLFAIMHNLHVDEVRRGQLELVDLDEQPAEFPVAPAQADRLVLRDLHRALTALPPEQCDVLMLVAVEGLGYAEAAQALGVPIGTVMSRLSRGRERLRRLLFQPARRPFSEGRGTARRVGRGDARLAPASVEVVKQLQC